MADQLSEPRYVADLIDSPEPTMLEAFVLLYHAPSGTTHLLPSPMPEILAAIDPLAGAATIGEIVVRLHEGYDLPDDATAVIAARVAELEAAGLVRRA